jgi:hypothetical protein
MTENTAIAQSLHDYCFANTAAKSNLIACMQAKGGILQATCTMMRVRGMGSSIVFQLWQRCLQAILHCNHNAAKICRTARQDAANHKQRQQAKITCSSFLKEA